MRESEEYWKSLSERIKDPVETRNKRPQTTDLEIAFIRNYVGQQDELLDIGSGSGLIINDLYPHVKSIMAVEKFEGFTKFIARDEKILVINADLVGFKIRKEFDCILSFGVSQCFVKADVEEMYKDVFSMTKPGGYFLVRMQCGIEKGKTVNGFSEELQTDYFADYRHWQEEVQLLRAAGFGDVEKFDIFPDSLNVWPDTRHYIFVCKKK